MLTWVSSNPVINCTFPMTLRRSSEAKSVIETPYWASNRINRPACRYPTSHTDALRMIGL